uniref:Immunoglobulin V-set domain-containing protein n=1 Tax=Lepisosteus oculatus TaxID=7918 RepID=W5MKU4_LEPOC
CFVAEAVTITTPHLSINASVQDDVLFSVAYLCWGTPTIQWRFMSVSRIQSIVVWQPEVYENISDAYKDRLHTYDNGSIMLQDLSLKDSGYYVITVTEPSGTSKDAVIILKVTENLYEDLHFLAVFITALGAIAGFLMLSMWLLDKVVNRIKLKQRNRRQIEQEVIELQPLDGESESHISKEDS